MIPPETFPKESEKSFGVKISTHLDNEKRGPLVTSVFLDYKYYSVLWGL